MPFLSDLIVGFLGLEALLRVEVEDVKGYQVQYSTSKKFKKAKKVNIKKSSTTKLTVKKLKKKKKYYVRMRSYKMVNGKKVYSSWSKKQNSYNLSALWYSIQLLP